ncbi:hypothetical protein [Amycolatopsis sp. NBC_01286]
MRNRLTTTTGLALPTSLASTTRTPRRSPTAGGGPVRHDAGVDPP